MTRAITQRPPSCPMARSSLRAGLGFGEPSNDNYYVLDSAQVYDPVTGSWTAIANMHAKASLTAARLQPDGKVLVVGSLSPKGFPARIHAELYDPATETGPHSLSRPGLTGLTRSRRCCRMARP